MEGEQMIRKMKRKGQGSKYVEGKAASTDTQCIGCKMAGNEKCCQWCKASRAKEQPNGFVYLGKGRVRSDFDSENRGSSPLPVAIPSATAIAQSVGKYKAQLDIMLRDKFPDIVSEHKFHPVRRWKFDYALTERRIAFEYEGIFSEKSRHTGVTGYIGDIDKYNEAQLMRWQVYRFTAKHLQDGRAWDLIEKL